MPAAAVGTNMYKPAGICNIYRRRRQNGHRCLRARLPLKMNLLGLPPPPPPLVSRLVMDNGRRGLVEGRHGRRSSSSHPRAHRSVRRWRRRRIVMTAYPRRRKQFWMLSPALHRHTYAIAPDACLLHAAFWLRECELPTYSMWMATALKSLYE